MGFTKSMTQKTKRVKKAHIISLRAKEEIHRNTIRHTGEYAWLDKIVLKKHGWIRAVIDSIVDITMVTSTITTLYYIAFSFPGPEMQILDGIL